jgi:hypothetical protein
MKFVFPNFSLKIQFLSIAWSWDSALGVVTDYGLDGQGVGLQVLVGTRFFFCPRCPDQF